jgi:hypothetical protein
VQDEHAGRRGQERQGRQEQQEEKNDARHGLGVSANRATFKSGERCP